MMNKYKKTYEQKLLDIKSLSDLKILEKFTEECVIMFFMVS